MGGLRGELGYPKEKEMGGAGTALLRARGLRKDYGKGEGLVRAVD